MGNFSPLFALFLFSGVLSKILDLMNYRKIGSLIKNNVAPTIIKFSIIYADESNKIIFHDQQIVIPFI